MVCIGGPEVDSYSTVYGYVGHMSVECRSSNNRHIDQGTLKDT